MATAVIRQATLSDSEAVARLVTELGYPTSPSQMRRRLEPILLDQEYATLVATEDERIVGFIGTRLGPLYESDDLYGQIMALAVAADHQKRGVGTSLIRSAESMLVERGVRVFVLTTGNQRGDAHAFYEKNGYAFTGRRYKKSLLSLA